jgi:hypothetical protein
VENIPLLDIVIGLSLIYTFLSLLASELTEFTIAVLQWKNKCFTQCIITLLGETPARADPDRFKDTIANKILISPRIVSVTQSVNRRRRTMALSNVTPQLFAKTLLEVLQNLPQPVDTARPQAADNPIATIQSTVACSPHLSPSLRTNLTRLIHRAQTLEATPQQQMTQLEREIAHWFSQAMAEVSNTYKHDYKLVSLLVSLSLTMMINVDSLYIIRRISENTAMRAITMQNATQIQGCQGGLNSPQCIERLSALMESTTIPIGWQPSNRRNQFAGLNGVILLRTIGGWFLTSIAIAMGARFWLQLLKRLGAALRQDSQPQQPHPASRYSKSKSSAPQSIETQEP